MVSRDGGGIEDKKENSAQGGGQLVRGVGVLHADVGDHGEVTGQQGNV